MTSDKVSVIVPVYNTERYLEKCIHSLLSQTHNNIEIIIVNDGSTDDSQKIIEEIADTDDRILSLQKENGGLSDARNYGIKHSTGAYLAFVDSDDWVEPTFIEEMLVLLLKYKAEMAICNLQKVNQNGKVFKHLTQLPQFSEEIDLKEHFEIFGDLSWFACNKLFVRELFEDISFPKGVYFEDVATIPKILLRCKKVVITHSYLYNYFERTGSITRSFNEKGLDIFYALEEVKRSFEKSVYKGNVQEWKRFVILQGFYSFIAYVARVKDRNLQRQMFMAVKNYMQKENISKKEILQYERHGRLYFSQITLKKAAYYIFALTKL